MAMWMMLQQDEPDDFVICTGKAHSVREFCDLAFKHVNLSYEDYVLVDPIFFRPADVELLLSNANKVATILKWWPTV